jgi:two-component system, chemotaxis family, sensor kinase Cph1
LTASFRGVKPGDILGHEFMGRVVEVGPGCTLKKAARVVACLDMNLNGILSQPIAEVLTQRAIPFVIVTGYSDRNVTDPAFVGAPIVHKPFSADALARRIGLLLPP